MNLRLRRVTSSTSAASPVDTLARHGPRLSHPVGTLARVTHDDDARARALEENRRRSDVMAHAQRYGPPAPRRTPPDLTPEADESPVDGPRIASDVASDAQADPRRSRHLASEHAAPSALIMSRLL